MKKISKQIFALALLMGLILSSLSPTVALAANDGSISLKNALNGKKYDLYRVFDLTYNEQAGAYTYTVAKKGFETTLFEQYPQLDSGKTMLKGGEAFKIIDAEALLNKGFTKEIAETTYNYINPYDFSIWLQDKITNFEKVGDQKTAASDKDANIKWGSLALGYYMVKSDAGTVVSLTTTDKIAEVYEKNILPSLTKQVKGGSATEFADLTYANIGEEIEFKITFDVHNHANTQYVLKDVVPEGIDVESTQTISIQIDNGADGAFINLETEKYTVNKAFTDEDAQGIKNLEITFPLTTIQEIAASLRSENQTVEGSGLATKKTITVTYKGKLNNDALLSNHSEVKNNRNEASLQYDPNTSIEPAKAHADVRTTDFNVFKFFKESETVKNPLANAKFKIYTTATGGEALKFTKVGEGEDYFYDTAGDVTEITTTETGRFSIKGLKIGTYYIEETQAPDGFNQLQARIPLVISGTNENVTYGVGDSSEGILSDNTVEIENQGGKELPETGGRGRQLIYTLGGVLFAGSLVLLIAKKRSEKEEIK